MEGLENFGLRGVKPVLLSGGKGTRLWPLSVENCPKQYVRDPLITAALDQPAGKPGLPGNFSMFQLTLLRCHVAGLVMKPLIVASLEHKNLVLEQLLETGVEADILFEPESADTAMAISVAAEFLCQKSGSVEVLYLPCDHYIDPVSAFSDAIKRGLPLSREGKLVSFGISPDRASSSYGYIAPHWQNGFGEEHSPQNDYRVDSFVEKPDPAHAQQLVEDGNYWNSGMFLSNSFALQGEFFRRAPDIAGFARTAIEALERLGGEMELPTEPYNMVRRISFDRAVMEHTRKSHMVVAKFAWRDLGSWSTIAETVQRDETHNAGIGNYVVLDGSGNFVRASRRLIVLDGVSNLSIIEGNNAIIVQKAQETSCANTLLGRLREKGCLLDDEPEITGFQGTNRCFPKPWGWFEVLQSGPGYQVKKLVVECGGRLSLQRHKSRNEHWVVVAGKGMVTCNEVDREITVDDTISIYQGDAHRLENRHTSNLELIEVQTGSYLEEDDIERMADDYGRA